MRKSKKRVFAIITCCFILCTFCIGVFADETTQEEYDPYTDRVGVVVESKPFDLGELLINFDETETITLHSGYYIIKVEYKHFVNNDGNLVTNRYYDYSVSNVGYMSINNGTVSVGYESKSDHYMNYENFSFEGSYYIYSFFMYDITLTKNSNYNGDDLTLKIYSISNGTDINNSIYSNSQDVHSSLVSVIDEATNVITTNNVVMMFCILIPVISFGVGILIRLRKRA